MKLLFLEASSGAALFEPLWKLLIKYFQDIARAGAKVEMRHLPVAGDFVRSLYAELLNNRNVVESACRAQVDGFDAVILGCWADPLWEVRSELDIPVVSIGESSLLMAHTLGARFAVITVASGVVPLIEMDLKLYGLEGRAIQRPVRSIEPPSDAKILLESVENPYARFIPRFEIVARECIADGAEVIVNGCGYYGPILSAHGYTEIPGTGVPVLDCTAAGLKFAEMHADLYKSIGLRKSTAGYFKSTPKETMVNLRQTHGLG